MSIQTVINLQWKDPPKIWPSNISHYKMSFSIYCVDGGWNPDGHMFSRPYQWNRLYTQHNTITLFDIILIYWSIHHLPNRFSLSHNYIKQIITIKYLRIGYRTTRTHMVVERSLWKTLAFTKIIIIMKHLFPTPQHTCIIIAISHLWKANVPHPTGISQLASSTEHEKTQMLPLDEANVW